MTAAEPQDGQVWPWLLLGPAWALKWIADAPLRLADAFAALAEACTRIARRLAARAAR